MSSIGFTNRGLWIRDQASSQTLAGPRMFQPTDKLQSVQRRPITDGDENTRPVQHAMSASSSAGIRAHRHRGTHHPVIWSSSCATPNCANYGTAARLSVDAGVHVHRPAESAPARASYHYLLWHSADPTCRDAASRSPRARSTRRVSACPSYSRITGRARAGLAHGILLVAQPQGLEAVIVGFDECAGWLPTSPRTDYKCTESGRLREVEAFLCLRDRDLSGHDEDYSEALYAGVRRLEACALGLVACPERPLIVALWPDLEAGSFFAETERQAQLAWRDDIADGVAQFRYVFIQVYESGTALRLVGALRASVHQVWMGERDALECIQNPRCVGDDYVAALDRSMVPNATALPDAERGPVELWRLMVTSWGWTRPSRAHSPGHDLGDWGVARMPSGEESWSLHPLGRAHIISPYQFPDHAWVPFTHAHACDPSSLSVAQKPKPSGGALAQRTVLILGDTSHLATQAAHVNWARVYSLLYGLGYNVTFAVPSTPSIPSRNSWIKALSADPEAYPELPGGGRGRPLGYWHTTYLDTPCIAMCRGTPAVFPALRDLSWILPLQGWERFDPSWAEHDQYYVDEPEPYGFKYVRGNDDELASALWRAIESGKNPHTPRQFGPLGLYESLEGVLNYEYKDEYLRRREEEGTPIGLAEDLRVHCWEQGWCRKDP
ncbi:hypothetical protein CspeluHIS016_0404150 [Cutaneotrichosporon spelunceum]|uniref:Uncharacterized protein n=1 Tax=Cutaneotrichosporon spelunceum TaxID=1672016 RepID=A0AAD3TVC6_9TREE|nr:hypothetical protein CspeluHIS016_0404150 [Cutaneotrichosporon spelunceum]